MTLHEKLDSDMKSALRQQNAVQLSVLRMAVSAIRTREIEKNVKCLDDADVLQILQRQIKQHKESIDQFTKGNRPDLVEKESQELKILESYMPPQLSDEEIAAIVRQIIAELGAKTKADSGKVMKAVMEKVKGTADGRKVSQIAMSLLP